VIQAVNGSAHGLPISVRATGADPRETLRSIGATTLEQKEKVAEKH
jgi:hypothetical protein